MGKAKRKAKYKNIVAEMKKNKESQTKIAYLLNLTTYSLIRKIQGITEWKISEIEILCNHWNKDYYELFKKGDD